jgi:hypothetical protein
MAPRRILFAILLALGGVLASGPGADAAVIPGSPLRVSTDEYGHTQARFEGLPDGEFAPANLDLANAGMLLIAYWPNGQAASPQGMGGNPLMPVSGPTLSGAGTEADPYLLTTVFQTDYPVNLEVTRVLEYVDGDSGFVARYTITNNGIDAAKFRLMEWANLAHASSSLGEGFFDPGPPAFVGAENLDQGSAGGLLEVDGSPWSRYQESEALGTPWNFGFLGAGLTNTVDPALIDDVVAIQFDRYTSFGLPAGETDSFELAWVFERFDGLTLDAPTTALPVGTSVTVNAQSLNHGVPVTGTPIRYSVTGANPTSGSVTAALSGSAAISWQGAKAGTDTLTAFVDSNGSGSFDDGEVEATVQIGWQAPPTPSVVDTTAPVASATLRRKLRLLRTLRLGLVEAIQSNEAGIAIARASVSGTAAKRFGLPAARRVIVARGRVAIPAPGRAVLRLKFTRSAKRKLKAARRVRLAVTTTITDPAGNRTRLTKTTTLERR